jgi:hypothetical protein
MQHVAKISVSIHVDNKACGEYRNIGVFDTEDQAIAAVVAELNKRFPGLWKQVNDTQWGTLDSRPGDYVLAYTTKYLGSKDAIKREISSLELKIDILRDELKELRLKLRDGANG